MENNQAHKIDKIFKNSLDNQSVTPPTDAWMAVHTYTIGQEESKKKVWLRYVSLALVLLLFSGLGFWYNINLNSDSSDLRISGLKTHNKIQKSTNLMNPNSDEILSSILLSQELLVENTNNGETHNKIQKSINKHGTTFRNPNSDRVSSDNVNSKLSTLTSSRRILKSINRYGATFRNPNSDNIFSHEPKLLSYQVDWSGDQPRDGENAGRVLKNDSTQYLSKVEENNTDRIGLDSDTKINNIQPAELMAKNYASTDLSKKMNETLMNVIPDNYLEEDSDLEETGKKFSLRHPIFSYGAGITWNDWTVKSNDYNIYTPSFNSGISKTSFIRLGVTWKVNKKTRLGFNIGIFNSGSFIIGWQGPMKSSGFDFPQIIFNSDNSNPSYMAETPFGNVKIPIKTLTDNGFNIDTSNPSKAIQVSYGDLHSLTYTQGEISLENDLLNRKRKSGYSYQIYSVSNLTFQRQISYNYWARDILTGLSSLGTTLPKKISITENHLENGAAIVWGIKYGVGFRWQFAKKWNFNIEGVIQNSLNSWVRNQPYTTNQKLYSIQTGIQLNL